MREKGLLPEQQVLHTEIGDFHYYPDNAAADNYNQPLPEYNATAAHNYQLRPQPNQQMATTATPQDFGMANSATATAMHNYAPDAFATYNAPELSEQKYFQHKPYSPQDIHRKIFNRIDCGGMSPEFADKIAYAESRGGCRDNINDYGCVNNSASAFGRYQMQVPALKDAGFINSKGKFLPETGVNNMQEFLNNPEAQEQAMCNYLDKIDGYNQNWNNYKYLGENVQIGNLNVPITKDMMLAGTHREGARKLNEWLNDVELQNHQFVRNPAHDLQDEKRRNITNRFKEILFPPK